MEILYFENRISIFPEIFVGFFEMIKSKSIELLKILTLEEFKNFGKFLSSKFCNNNKNLLSVYPFLKKYYPAFNQDDFTKKNMFSFIFGDSIYRDDRVRELLSELNKAVELFIAFDTIKKNKYHADELVLKYLMNERILFEKKYNDINMFVDNLHEDEVLKFRKKFFIEQLNYESSFFESKLMADIDSIKNAHDYLVRFFILQILDIYSLTHSASKVKSITPEFPFLDFVIDNIKKNKYEDAPDIQFHLNCLLVCMHDNNRIYYENLKAFTLSHLDKLPYDNFIKAFITLTNFCNINSIHDRNYFAESVDLYKKMLKVYVSPKYFDNYIPNMLFITIINNSVSAGEIEWANKFVEEFREKIALENRLSIYNYGKMLISVSLGEFNDALHHLSLVKADDHWMKVCVKEFTAIIYFELGEIELLYNSIDSYVHFLESNKELTQNKINVQKKFVRLLKNLTSLKLKPQEFELLKLKKSAQKDTFPHKRWLLEKIESIEKTFL